MTEYRRVATLSQIPENGALCVQVAGKRIGLFNLAGEIFAIDDRCTHAAASLCEGMIQGDEVVCPMHMATFDIKTGQVTGPPAGEDLQCYPVRVQGESVEVEV